MVKKIGYCFLFLILLLLIAGYIGIRWFNNMWFKDRPNHLEMVYDSAPMDFVWAEGRYDEHFEPHAAIMVPAKIEGLNQPFYFQLDTGAPSTMIYGKPLESLKKLGLDISELTIDDEKYVDQFDFTFSGSPMKMGRIEIMENYGSSFEIEDSLKSIKLGTIGADFLVDKITLIDFKNEKIQLYSNRPEWMDTLPDFKPFDFQGRRLMLPSNIDGKKQELFYDSGCSSFGLLTSKHRYDKYTDKNVKEINYSGNRWGDALPIHHKPTNKGISIGGANLELKRISYVGMYAKYQRFMTPFTRIDGWLGNKPFTESIMIIDAKEEEFLVVEDVE